MVKTMRESVKQTRILQSVASEALRKAHDSKKRYCICRALIGSNPTKDGAGASNPPESALAHAQQELYCHNKLENANKPSDDEDDGEDSSESEKGEDQHSQDTSGSSQNSDDSSEGGDERDGDTDETYTDAEYIMDEDNLTSIRLHRLSPEKPAIPTLERPAVED